MFEKKAIRHWRRFIFREVEKIGFRPAHRGFSAAMVMMTVYSFGTDVDVLVELTGFSAEFVIKTLRRLRKQKILVGQKMRVARWDDDGALGAVGVALDALVAADEVSRFPNPKASAAQKARAPETRARGPRTRRAPKAVGIFTPQVKNCDSLYGLTADQRQQFDAEKGSRS